VGLLNKTNKHCTRQPGVQVIIGMITFSANNYNFYQCKKLLSYCVDQFCSTCDISQS